MLQQMHYIIMGFQAGKYRSFVFPAAEWLTSSVTFLPRGLISNNSDGEIILRTRRVSFTLTDQGI